MLELLLAPSIRVADDDAAIASLAREVVEEAGYLVAIAATHATALEVLTTTRYDLILADTAGAPLADTDPAHWRSVEEVRAAASVTPVVIFSAHPPRAFQGYRERGFAGLITKPFDLDDLLAAARTVLAARTEGATGDDA